MGKKDRVSQILAGIREQAEELLENESTEEMTAEEIIVLATEMTTYTPVTMIEYEQPIGRVDRERVSFMIDEEFELPLFSDEEYYEDSDI